MGDGNEVDNLLSAQRTIDELRQLVAQQTRVIEAQARRMERLEGEIAALKGKLEEALRAGKRQAGPFSRNKPKADPQKPGQKPGHESANRAVPNKSEIKRVVKARLPLGCECGGHIFETEQQPQYQFDLPRPIPIMVTQFDVSIGYCEACGKRHQGRHPEQTSDALGAAGVQIGPNVLAMTAELKHAYGMSYGAITKFLKGMSGLTVERSALVRGDERLANKLMPTYNQLILRLREKQVVYGDETGWRVGGKPAWLWAFDSDDITVYEIDPTRKHEVIERILTAKFKGVLKSDCFVAYDDEDLAGIQKSKCLGHLIRRSRDIELVKSGRAVQFSKRVTQLLRAAIRLKACMSQMTQHGYAVARGRLEAALDRLLAGNYSDKDNARLARLLLKQRHALFNFLDIPGCDATNNAAERAIRPAVIIRKTNGCNRTDRGKSTHKIIASVLRTCAKQGRNFGDYAAALLRVRQMAVLSIAMPRAKAAPA